MDRDDVLLYALGIVLARVIQPGAIVDDIKQSELESTRKGLDTEFEF